MSILIAYKKNDTVYMGTDTRVIVNDFKKNEICESNYKIQKLENGILLGMIAYVLMNLVTGKTKKLSIAMYILAILFILKFIFI